MEYYVDKTRTVYDIEYNGETNKHHGLLMYDFLDEDQPQEDYTEYKIPGRDGSLFASTGYYKTVKKKARFSLISDMTPERLRDVRNWLSGTGTLKTSEDEGYYYKVKKVVYGNMERELRRFGVFEVTFLCDPYCYLEEGLEALSSYSSVDNRWAVSHPVYVITGNVAGALRVNGNAITVNVSGNLTIDTDRRLAYREDGTYVNSSISGDYEDMYLVEGTNTITISSGLSLTVYPHWRML